MDAELESQPGETAQRLSDILAMFWNLRVCIVGTTCLGKTTLQRAIPGTQDMDRLLFGGLLDPDEVANVSQPWSPEVGKTMTELAKRYLYIEPGQPLFSTVVFDCDVIVHLVIDDGLLAERAATRGVEFSQAKAMQEHIASEVAAASIPTVHFVVS